MSYLYLEEMIKTLSAVCIAGVQGLYCLSVSIKRELLPKKSNVVGDWLKLCEPTDS